MYVAVYSWAARFLRPVAPRNSNGRRVTKPTTCATIADTVRRTRQIRVRRSHAVAAAAVLRRRRKREIRAVVVATMAKSRIAVVRNRKRTVVA